MSFVVKQQEPELVGSAAAAQAAGTADADMTD